MERQFKKLFLLLFLLPLAWQVQAQKYEAEYASYSGVSTTQDISGYSGNGAIRFENEGEYVTVTANVSSAGSYKVYVSFASPYGSKVGNVSVNGSSGSYDFYQTSSCAEMYIGQYNFSAGNNTITVSPNWTWFYVDYIRIEGSDGDGGDGGDDNPPTPTGGFKVSGTKLLDANGNEFIMRGVNMAWTWYQSSGMSQLEAIARAGANTVRIVLSDGTKWDETSSTTVASLISKCEALKMIAVLEVHDHTGNNNASNLAAAANYFVGLKDVLIGKESTVIVNIANEWYGSWDYLENWENGYKSAISTLRSAGINHCIMVDAAGWGQCAASIHDRGANVLNSDPNKNIIFSIHMYGTAGKTSAVKSNIDGALNRNLALCIGEFGWYHSDGDVDEDLILSYCKEKNVGWLAWSWYGNGEGVEYLDLVTQPGNESAVNSPNYNGNSCNWGQKIINSWKSEAETCTVYVYTGVSSSLESAEWSVYPTYVTSLLNIEAPAGTSIQIRSLGGKCVARLSANDGLTLISTDSWTPGMYLVTISYNNESKTYKVIK